MNRQRQDLIPEPGRDRVYLLQVLVVGASTTVTDLGMERKAPAEFYHVPLVATFCLDSVTERLSSRGLGNFWREVPGLVSGPQ